MGNRTKENQLIQEPHAAFIDILRHWCNRENIQKIVKQFLEQRNTHFCHHSTYETKRQDGKLKASLGYIVNQSQKPTGTSFWIERLITYTTHDWKQKERERPMQRSICHLRVPELRQGLKAAEKGGQFAYWEPVASECSVPDVNRISGRLVGTLFP